jgi:hypothetical protein
MDYKRDGGVSEGMRTCGACTKCCDGTLAIPFGDIPTGQPCPKLGDGRCLDYENRPDSPCKNFLCEWLRRPGIYPDGMRPDKCGTLFIVQNIDGKPNLIAVDTKGKNSLNFDLRKGVSFRWDKD